MVPKGTQMHICLGCEAAAFFQPLFSLVGLTKARIEKRGRVR